MRRDLAVRVALLAAMLLGILVYQTVAHRHARGAAPVRALNILRRGNGSEPESLDPHAARSESALTILRDVFEGLAAIGPGGAPVLAAADRCDISADGTIYRFHLRANGRWSNGDPVVAEDFVAAWRRLIDPHTGAQYAQLLAPIRGAQAIGAGSAQPSTLGARAENDSTLIVELAHPTPYFLALLTHPATFPLNRASLAAHGRGFAKPGVLVSNGPFVLTRWDFGSHLVAARNPRYWNDAATRLDGVEYYSIAEQSTEIAAYRSGALDITSTIPASQFAWIKNTFGAELHVAPQLAVYYLGLNLRKAPFAGAVPLRRALSMVIDRERLVSAVTGTGEAAAYSFVPPQTFNYSPPQPDYAGWPMERRIAVARQLLADAGLSTSPPRIELSYSGGELHNRIAVAVAAMWHQALGVDVSLHAEEFKALLQDIDRGEVQAFRASWLADYDDAYSFLQLLQSGFGINPPRYSDAEYDGLLARAANEGDADRRRNLLQRAEARMLADQPLIPLYFYVAKHLVSTRIHGWQDNSMNVVYSKNLLRD